MWYFVVLQPSNCNKSHFQPQIWSIWPIFPNDSESLPKFCYIKRKNSEILNKLRNSESAGGSVHDSVDNYSMGQRHLKTWPPPRRCSSHPPHQPRANHSCQQQIVVGDLDVGDSGEGAGGLVEESTPLSPCCKVIFHWEIRDSEREWGNFFSCRYFHPSPIWFRFYDLYRYGAKIF